MNAAGRTLATRLARAGRGETDGLTAVNPPVQRGSTVLAPTVAALYGEGPTYGLSGFAVHDALRSAMVDLLGAAGCALVPSGLAACTVALLALAERGGRVLVPDSVYGPTRRFCDGTLARFGVATEYYDPRIGSDIADLLSTDVCAVLLESPGSLTFEVQDVPAICAVARAKSVPTLIDDTWSAGVLFHPFAHGVDVSCQALTKHQGGHADLLLGAICAREAALQARIERTIRDFGLGCGAAEDAALALRGMRTMLLRLEKQGAAGLKIAHWLAQHGAVADVLHPGLSNHPDHDLFRRDFSGSAGVFSIVLRQPYGAAVDEALESLALFGLGFSWGGYESLAIPCDQQLRRTATSWSGKGALIRLSIGLEDPDELIADLAQGLDRLSVSSDL